MNRLLIVIALPLVLTAGIASAQKPADTHRQSMSTAVSPGELKATPEMWFYEQYMRNYKDPKMAVRARAEYRADQRQRRLESMRWFGFSSARPTASADPFNGDYSPHWVASPGYFPNRWPGVGPSYY
jgi:hypothetical protein